MSDQDYNPDLERKCIEEEEKILAAQLEETRKRLQQLKEEQERRFNDPKERAKMLKNANDMIDAGIKDYESKGYFCEVLRDENGVISKITIKIGKSTKSGSRGPRKKAGDPGFIPAMTGEQFEQIYGQLNQSFVSSDIEKLLTQVCGGEKYRLQPKLKEIADKGYNRIKIQSNGMRGRAAGYIKIS